MAKKKTTAGAAKKPTAAAATEKARVLGARLAASGKTTRVKGHVSARTRRSQAKRDGKSA
jgi:hypothetical protein